VICLQGVPTDFAASKLRAGFGPEICYVLNTLAQNALKAKRWKWAKFDHFVLRYDQPCDGQHLPDVSFSRRPDFGYDDYQEDTAVDEDIEVTLDQVAEVEEVKPSFRAHRSLNSIDTTLNNNNFSKLAQT
jgi:hypothetical protein